jgi:hypothetical protein
VVIYVVMVIQALNVDNDVVMMLDQMYRYPHNDRTFTIVVYIFL